MKPFQPLCSTICGFVVIRIIYCLLDSSNPDILIITTAILWCGYTISQAIVNNKKSS